MRCYEDSATQRTGTSPPPAPPPHTHSPLHVVCSHTREGRAYSSSQDELPCACSILLCRLGEKKCIGHRICRLFARVFHCKLRKQKPQTKLGTALLSAKFPISSQASMLRTQANIIPNGKPGCTVDNNSEKGETRHPAHAAGEGP